MKEEIERERELIYATENKQWIKVMLIKLKGENKMNKFKKIMKYAVNIINFANAIIIGITPIWGIPYGEEISKTLIVVAGAISVYLVGQKAIAKGKE